MVKLLICAFSLVAFVPCNGWLSGSGGFFRRGRLFGRNGVDSKGPGLNPPSEFITPPPIDVPQVENENIAFFSSGRRKPTKIMTENFVNLNDQEFAVRPPLPADSQGVDESGAFLDDGGIRGMLERNHNNKPVLVGVPYPVVYEIPKEPDYEMIPMPRNNWASKFNTAQHRRFKDNLMY